MSVTVSLSVNCCDAVLNFEEPKRCPVRKFGD